MNKHTPRLIAGCAVTNYLGYHGVIERGTEERISPRRAEGIASPGGKRTPERRTPKKATAPARVEEVGPRTASPALDASLRLAAQQHHKIRALAGLRAQLLVRDDQGRSRRDPGDAIQYVLRNDNAIEHGFCAVGVRRHRLNVATTAPAHPAVWFNCAAGRTSA